MAALPQWMLHSGNQIDGDRWLVEFKTYEEYLDFLVTPTDLKNLRSTHIAQTIAELGYRSAGETLTREQFNTRRERVVEMFNPTRKSHVLCAGRHPDFENVVLQELGTRERANRVGLLATIIFVRALTPAGHEVSGYVDYAHRLNTEDWMPFFQGKKRLWPRPNDLGYYHWRAGISRSNHSPNFKVIIDPERGLLFQNKYDRKVVCVDPSRAPGQNTTREVLKTNDYKQFVVYDHVVRRRS
ncbi:hypothetical protein R5R35_000801 [Gryllus longicercus]|uniref:Cilia- and flagella-associated protein 299 n=1 Tax=Gryllus longicercus TaxID=2509291 RepID=A0AAN9ZAP4_9ORTH